MTRSPAALRPRGQLDLAHSTAHWIKAAHRALQQSLQARLEPFGIKLSHWHCLRYLIRRVRDQHDQRKYMVSLTPRARRITRQLLPVAGTVNRLGTAGFTKAEIELYRALTRRVIANLEAGADPEAGTPPEPAD